MIFPKGEIVHHNLSTSYTNVGELLASLRSQSFAGTVQVEAQAVRGLFFLSRGQVLKVEAEAEANGPRLSDGEAEERLLAVSGQRDGTVSVHRFTPEQMDFLTGTLKAEAVFKGLSTDFIWLDKLIAKLKEEGHTGHMEILTRESQPLGVLFMKRGALADLYITSDTGISFFFDQKSVSAFIDGVIRQGAIINIYRGEARDTAQESPAPDKETPAGGEVQEAKPASSRDRPAERFQETLRSLEELVGRIERVTDGLTRKGSFAKALKRSLSDKADLYPFLAPFRGQFEYEDGKLSFFGEVGTDEFVKGVGECLNLTLSDLKKEFPKSIVFPMALKAEIEASYGKYQETVRRSGVETVPPLFLQ